MAKTTIAWTQQTWNPTRGCSRVSKGCEHCLRRAHGRPPVAPDALYGRLTIGGEEIRWPALDRPGGVDPPHAWRAVAQKGSHNLVCQFDERPVSREPENGLRSSRCLRLCKSV